VLSRIQEDIRQARHIHGKVLSNPALGVWEAKRQGWGGHDIAGVHREVLEVAGAEERAGLRAEAAALPGEVAEAGLVHAWQRYRRFVRP